jgi:cytidylate kinase/L-amino acid N-acyltransferase YncA
MAGPVVTISRQLGSGGDEIATLVAQRLGVPLLDREVISRAAQVAGVSEEALRAAERHSSLLSRMLESLGKFGAAGGGEGVALEGLSSTMLLTTSADFRALLERVLREIAAAGPAVILGHAAQIALRDTPGTLHVFIHAPAEFRAAHLARTEGIPLAQARREIEVSDRERVRFYQSAYHVNWYDLRLYDLVLDTSVIGVHRAADVIAEVARQCCAEAPEPALTPAAGRGAGGEGEAATEPERAEAHTVTLNGETVHLRPMRPGDAGALLALARSLPPEDLLFLRRDVTDERVIDAWARDVADGRVITVLAESESGEVLGEASLYPSDVPWTRHVAEVRVITAPRVRGKGLGRILLREIMAAARAAGIEKLTAQMTVEQVAARRLFEAVGFKEEGRFRAYARDQAGAPHDLVVMTYTAPAA